MIKCPNCNGDGCIPEQEQIYTGNGNVDVVWVQAPCEVCNCKGKLTKAQSKQWKKEVEYIQKRKENIKNNGIQYLDDIAYMDMPF